MLAHYFVTFMVIASLTATLRLTSNSQVAPHLTARSPDTAARLYIPLNTYIFIILSTTLLFDYVVACCSCSHVAILLLLLLLLFIVVSLLDHLGSSSVFLVSTICWRLSIEQFYS